MACRVQDILDREVFVSLHHTVEGFKEAVTAGLGVNPAVGFSHSREMAKLVKAWNSAKVQAEVKTRVDAVAKAHGEPISMLKCDWISLMARFGDQHGENVHESRLPAQSYFENFEEALSDGSLEAERLDQVVNVLEERAELAKTPHAAKHLGIHLDSSLSIQTRRRFKSVLLATTEALRMKFFGHVESLASLKDSTTFSSDLRRLHRDDLSEDPGRAAVGEEFSPGQKHRWHKDDRTQVGTLLGVRVPSAESGDQAVCSQRVLVSVSLVDSLPRRGAQDGALDAVVDHRELELRPGTSSLGVSSCPQHRSGTAPPESRTPEAVSALTLAPSRTRSWHTAHSFGPVL